MQDNIISLQETDENSWQAKYQGNYGIYKIKIKLDEGEIIDFSCSCPSDYYPCKHIAMIKEAIDSRMAISKEKPKEKSISVEELLQDVPQKELVDFIARQAKYNPEFTNKLFLEFMHKAKGQPKDNYALVLRNALADIDYDYEDLYDYEDFIEMDVLDELFAKTSEYISQNRFDEAIAICKACIEEFAQWMEGIDVEIIDFISPDYRDNPFVLLSEIASNPEINRNELFQYCLREMDKPKYSKAYMINNFHDLLADLAQTKNNIQNFIALQDTLLQNIKDKSSYEAQGIIQRKINFYQNNHQPEIAWQLIVGNIQIESFCKQVVQRKITEGKLAEAKKMIVDFLSIHQNDNFRFHLDWQELALSIAQEEHDVPEIRKIAFSFIENHFESKHYHIYKSTFPSIEWQSEVQKILAHYEKKEIGFSTSVANVLTEEQDASKLIKYIEKHLSIDRLELYHSHFASSYPKETLDLFRKEINQYIDKNTGRSHYEYLLNLFKKMALIEGGKEMATTLITNYKKQYKNRRAMIEIFNRVHF